MPKKESIKNEHIEVYPVAGSTECEECRTMALYNVVTDDWEKRLCGADAAKLIGGRIAASLLRQLTGNGFSGGRSFINIDV